MFTNVYIQTLRRAGHASSVTEKVAQPLAEAGEELSHSEAPSQGTWCVSANDVSLGTCTHVTALIIAGRWQKGVSFFSL